jgi:hypothetical protein
MTIDYFRQTEIFVWHVPIGWDYAEQNPILIGEIPDRRE